MVHFTDDAMKALRARAKSAWAEREKWQKVLDEAYEYVAPYRQSTRVSDKSPSSFGDKIFDNTAPSAYVRTVGRLQQDLLPPGQSWFELAPGPAVAAFNLDPDEVAKELEIITRQIQPAFLSGEWDQAVSEMLCDAMISTGCMLILEGDERAPVRFVAPSMDEVALDQGAYGDVSGIFWKRKWKRRAVRDEWPKGKFSDEFRTSLESKPEDDVTVCQDTIWDARARVWRWCVHEDGKTDAPFAEAEYLECPWLTPRYWRLPGQVNGVGPVLMNLPGIKTLNKAQQLTLQNAAVEMAGIFTRIDDGVFNPDTARIEPGAFWTVARNGGVLGPSIQRLQGGNMNVSNIVLSDLRMQVATGMFDQQLPPDGQTPRSAAEIVERVKRLQSDHAGAFGRMVHEIILPAVRRVIEVLYRKGVLKSRFKIDQLLIQVKVTSPLGQAFRATKAKAYVDWLQVAAGLGGPEMLHALTPLDLGLAEVGAQLGVEPHLIYSKNERESIQASVKALVAQAMAQMQAQNAGPPPPPNGDPAQAAA